MRRALLSQQGAISSSQDTLLSRGRLGVQIFFAANAMETGWPKVSHSSLFTWEAVTKNGKAAIKRKDPSEWGPAGKNSWHTRLAVNASLKPLSAVPAVGTAPRKDRNSHSSQESVIIFLQTSLLFPRADKAFISTACLQIHAFTLEMGPTRKRDWGTSVL